MKKIAICGKGGVGKSFLTFVLTNAFLDQGFKVIVVDGDESNFSLHKYFGFPSAPQPLVDFLGGKPALKEVLRKSFQSKTEPTLEEVSPFNQKTFKLSDFPEEYVLKKGDMALVSIGKIRKSLEGCACPYGFLTKKFLEKIALEEGEVLLLDTEAGVEHFGRGIEKEVDAVIVVAEPYLDSIEVGKRAYNLAKELSKRTFFVLNKAPHELREKALELCKANGLEVDAVFPYSSKVYEASILGKVGLVDEVLVPAKELASRILLST
jgi:CO dehydrogenase maturation factor